MTAQKLPSPQTAISTTNRHAELLRHIRTHLLRMWIRHLYRHPPMVRQAQGTYLFLAKKYRAMEGGLTTCRIAKRFCNPEKNPRKDFFSGKLRMTAHLTFDKPAFAGRLVKGIPVAKGKFNRRKIKSARTLVIPSVLPVGTVNILVVRGICPGGFL